MSEKKEFRPGPEYGAIAGEAILSPAQMSRVADASISQRRCTPDDVLAIIKRAIAENNRLLPALLEKNSARLLPDARQDQPGIFGMSEIQCEAPADFLVIAAENSRQLDGIITKKALC